MAGSNPQMIMDGYSAYNTGKMALLKLVEQLDHETPDAKFFALAPGTILPKIHQATTKAGWDNPKLDAALANPGDMLEQIERVHDCLMWCVAEEKRVIGGRNICVSDPYGEILSDALYQDSWKYKLRRAHEGG
jgi:NAD(P)-dependent dehydrogenase (short-subunit alcohol dehydrogenase family)